VFTPVLAKHSKSFSLIDCMSVGVDRMQRNFEPMRKQVEAWQRSELTDVTAKVVIYEAFVAKRQSTLLELYMTCTSNRSMRIFGRERSGVSRMRSRRHSRNWIPFHNSRPLRSWANFSRPGFPSLSKPAQGTAGRPPFKIGKCSAIATKGLRLHTQTVSCFDADKAGALRPLFRCTVVWAHDTVSASVALKGRNAAPSCFSALADVT